MKIIFDAAKRAFGCVIGMVLAKAAIRLIHDKALNDKAKEYIKD